MGLESVVMTVSRVNIKILRGPLRNFVHDVENNGFFSMRVASPNSHGNIGQLSCIKAAVLHLSNFDRTPHLANSANNQLGFSN